MTNYPYETTEGYNLRQQYLNDATREQLNDDGVLDVYVDIHGEMRGNGDGMNKENVQTILDALNYFDSLTGIQINFVKTERESELSIHKLNSAPGEGFEKWNPTHTRVKGIVHNKYPQDNNLYFEDTDFVDNKEGAQEHIIYHELAHIFGAYELAHPYELTSVETVMGYNFNAFIGYTEADKGMFESLYGGYDNVQSMYNQEELLQFIG